MIILNDEKLDGPQKTDFNSYFEKVIDASIAFAPTADECARIALSGHSPTEQTLKLHCIALGISNIRVIKQIQRLADIAVPLLANFDPSITQQGMQSLTLFGWSRHTDDAPTIEFIRDKRGKGLYDLTNERNLTADEKKWDALLDKYGFTRTDEFDLKLLEGIDQGYFDEPGLAIEATKLDAQRKANMIEGSFSAAWRLYHDTFDNNRDQLIAALETSFEGAVEYITPVNLNGTVRMLKGLGEVEKAKHLIEIYVNVRKGTPGIFDMDNYPFASSVDDEDVKKAFADQVVKIEDNRDPAAVLLDMAKHSGWSNEDIDLLSSLDVDAYYNIFKAAGSKSSHIIGACLLFNKLGGATEKQLKIGKNAEDALKKIGAESDLNRIRVRRYGIEIPT